MALGARREPGPAVDPHVARHTARGFSGAAAEREGKDLARFLGALGPLAKELLVANAAERVGGLLDSWPIFSPDNFESQVAMRARLASGAVVLSGTPDLVLGSDRAPDSVLVDAALAALLARHRAAEFNAAYASYDVHPLEEGDEWGDLASFRAPGAAS